MLPGYKRQIIFFLYCCLNIFIAGNAYTSTAPFVARLKEDPEISFSGEQISWIVSLFHLGSLMSSLPAAILANKYGTQVILLVVGPLNMFVWAVFMTSLDMWAFCLGRFLLGMAAGALTTLVPDLMTDVLELPLRKALVGMLQAAFYFGALFSYLIGPYFGYYTFYYICIIPPIVNFWFIDFFPESPVYLMRRGEDVKVMEILKTYRDEQDIEEEFATIKRDSEDGIIDSHTLYKSFTKKPLKILLIISALKVLTGMPVILNYSFDIFIAYKSTSPDIASQLLVFVIFISSLFSSNLHTHFRLWKILCIACLGCFLFHLLSGIFLFLFVNNVDLSNFNVLLLSVMFYSIFAVLGFNFTPGQLSFGLRGFAAGINNSLSSIFSFIVLKMFNPINEIEGYYVNFWFYSGVSLLGGLVIAFSLRHILT